MTLIKAIKDNLTLVFMLLILEIVTKIIKAFELWNEGLK
jgi:hypothetical protein